MRDVGISAPITTSIGTCFRVTVDAKCQKPLLAREMDEATALRSSESYRGFQSSIDLVQWLLDGRPAAFTNGCRDCPIISKAYSTYCMCSNPCKIVHESDGRRRIKV